MGGKSLSLSHQGPDSPFLSEIPQCKITSHDLKGFVAGIHSPVAGVLQALLLGRPSLTL